MATKGKFIVFEGTDGSGKSTQMKMLGKYLKTKGIPVYGTHEPTESPFGALLRSCLTGRVETDERAIAALFAADRIDHITNSVNGLLKKLDEGVTVLCDRYYFSSFAYNGGFVPLDWVIELNKPAMSLLRPDLTIFLDLPAEESMDRQKRIRDKYFDIFRMFEGRENVAVIRSEEDKERTQANIRAAADKLFGGEK